MPQSVMPRAIGHRGTGHTTLPGRVRRPDRTASELGADMVKVNFPQPAKRDGVPEAYRGEFTPQQAIESVVRSAGRSLLLVSGGEHAGQEAMLEKARESMEAGATGLIFGRNVFQRSHDESLRFVAQLKEILAKYPS